MSHPASGSDPDESFEDSYVLQQPKPLDSRLTMTIEKATILNTEFRNEEMEETMEEEEEEESDCTHVSNSSLPGSATRCLQAMNPEQINELLDKLTVNDAESCNTKEGEENNFIIDSDEEESPRSTKINQKNVIKDKKGKKLVKPKIKREVLSKEVNQASDEQEILDNKVVKVKRGKKKEETETEIVKTNTRSAKGKMTKLPDNIKTEQNTDDFQDPNGENGAKVKPVNKGRGKPKPNNESEEENKVTTNPSNKRAQKNKADLPDPNEESGMKVKPVNKGKGKAKPNHKGEDETSTVKDTKGEEKNSKAPTNKKEVKGIETENFADAEKENKKPQRKTKPTFKKAIENQESETNKKADDEEIYVTRKRAARKNNVKPAPEVVPDHTNEEPTKKKNGRPKESEKIETTDKAPEVVPDHTNEELTKKKNGRPKESEKIETTDEPTNNDTNSKTAKANKVEKPKDSKKAQDAEPKLRGKKAAETQPVLVKRSTRNRKI